MTRYGAWILMAGLMLPAMSAGAWAQDSTTHSFRRERVLGTSFSLSVRGGSKEQAEACEQAVLEEIQRLNGILWRGDPASEISRLHAAKGSFACSADLSAVLRACDQWRVRTGGAFNANVGELVDLWERAAKAGRLPDGRGLAGAVRRLAEPAWRLHSSSESVQITGPLNLKVSGLAKGYIIDQALAAGRAKAPQARGILLDIGGDIAVWNAAGAKDDASWLVDVADPAHSEDNARAMARLRLANQAVATSGSYARYFDVGGKRYSHIIDPQTGRPADAVASATVVAGDCTSADALATALCVSPPSRGVALVDRLAHTECLVVDSSGKKYASRGWAALVAGTPAAPDAPAAQAAAGQWPSGYAVTVRLTLGASSSRRYKRPYVAVWVEDSDSKPVKMLALWGRESKYHKDLRSWYRLSLSAKEFRDQARAVTRASPRAGEYTLAWDGTGYDPGEPGRKTGTYTVRIEIVREKGGHVNMSAPIKCATGPDSARMEANGESQGAVVKYGPGGQ